MKQFLKNILSSAIGFILAGGILMIISFAFFAAMVASFSAMSFSAGDKKVKVKDHTIVKIEFDQPIVDRAERDPFSNVDFGPFKSVGSDGLNTILKTIKKAKEDDRVEGIYMNLSSIQTGMATLDEIREALLDFKSEGKWIITYSENLSQGAYYLATVSDEIYLHPQGEMMYKGLNAEIMFYKGLLDKLDVDMQIVRGSNNKFKSAVEPFIYTEMSDANREQMQKLLGSLWEHISTNVAEARGITYGELNVIADSLMVIDPAKASMLKVIDGLKYKDEFVTLLKEKMDVEDEDDLELISFNKYKSAKMKADKEEDDDDDASDSKSKSDEEVAVIYAYGSIHTGKGDAESIGSETIAKAIREARQDSSIKAIVMRVNSPGGSALASDIIWREAQLAKEAKPFIVSMGDYAASGGYYISCGADRIFANPNTITGSIGVFGMIPNVQGLMENKLGITTDHVKTNENAGYITGSRALTDFEYRKLQESVDNIYDTFLGHVASGRGMTKTAVDAIGQGRVWSGSDALELGLVDTLAGLNAAIDYAAKMANLEDYEVTEYPEAKDPFEEFMAQFSAQTKTSLIEEELGEETYEFYQRVKEVKTIEGVQTRMPFYIDLY